MRSSQWELHRWHSCYCQVEKPAPPALPLLTGLSEPFLHYSVPVSPEKDSVPLLLGRKFLRQGEGIPEF